MRVTQIGRAKDGGLLQKLPCWGATVGLDWVLRLHVPGKAFAGVSRQQFSHFYGIYHSVMEFCLVVSYRLFHCFTRFVERLEGSLFFRCLLAMYTPLPSNPCVHHHNIPTSQRDLAFLSSKTRPPYPRQRRPVFQHPKVFNTGVVHSYGPGQGPLIGMACRIQTHDHQGSSQIARKTPQWVLRRLSRVAVTPRWTSSRVAKKGDTTPPVRDVSPASFHDNDIVLELPDKIQKISSYKYKHSSQRQLIASIKQVSTTAAAAQRCSQ
jgi:hypothetical protein